MAVAARSTKRRIALALALVLAATLIVAATTSGITNPSPGEGEVAVVDGVEGATITDEDLDRALDQAATNLGLEEVPPTDDPQYQSLLEEAMQTLLVAQWVEGEAAERGIEVTAEDEAAQLERIKTETYESEAEFERAIERLGFSDEDVDQQVRLSLLQEELQRTVLPGQEDLPVEELLDFYGVDEELVADVYEANTEQFETPASRDVRIVVNSSEEQVEEARNRLEEDDSEESWEEVTAELSQDQASKDRGGLLEGLVEGTGDPRLEEEAFSAPEGELVGPFETDRGFVLLQVVAINEAATQSLTEAEAQLSQELLGARQQQASTDFQSEFASKWTTRTTCAEEATVVLCSNFELTVPEAAASGASPPPVPSRQPIAPGGAAVTGTGGVQQGSPQGPQTPMPDPVAAPELPPGAVPIGPGGAPQPAPGAPPVAP